MLKVRFCEEQEGGFGNGRIIAKGFPICEAIKDFAVGGLKEVSVDEAVIEDEVNNCLKFTIPAGVKKDREIKSIAKDVSLFSFLKLCICFYLCCNCSI